MISLDFYRSRGVKIIKKEALESAENNTFLCFVPSKGCRGVWKRSKKSPLLWATLVLYFLGINQQKKSKKPMLSLYVLLCYTRIRISVFFSTHRNHRTHSYTIVIMVIINNIIIQYIQFSTYSVYETEKSICTGRVLKLIPQTNKMIRGVEVCWQLQIQVIDIQYSVL